MVEQSGASSNDGAMLQHGMCVDMRIDMSMGPVSGMSPRDQATLPLKLPFVLTILTGTGTSISHTIHAPSVMPIQSRYRAGIE